MPPDHIKPSPKATRPFAMLTVEATVPCFEGMVFTR
jgi:hypothetical protein